MTQLQFLCVHQRRWIKENPEAALRTWMQAHSRGVELAQESQHLEAARHAGGAYEAADMLLAHAAIPSPVDIRRFCDSGLLLIQLLYLLDEAQLAAAVMASALGRLEGLLRAGCDRQAVMSGCQRLQQFAECVPCATRTKRAPTAAQANAASAHIH